MSQVSLFEHQNFHKNTNYKFHKVVQMHYLGEVENIYKTLSQRYSGQQVQNFIRIGLVLQTDVTKTFGVFLGFTVPTAVHLQNANASFTTQCSNIIQVSYKTLKLLYRKFIQDNVYQILSESTGLCERYDKKIKHFGFFRFTVQFNLYSAVATNSLHCCHMVKIHTKMTEVYPQWMRQTHQANITMVLF